MACDCDTVTYRYAAARTSHRDDQLTDDGGSAHIQSLYGVRYMSVRYNLFVSPSLRPI